LKIITLNASARAENSNLEEMSAITSRLQKIICLEFNAFKLDYSIICVDKFKLKKDNRPNDPFNKFVKRYFHDRNYFSNFLYCKSGNSGDYNKYNEWKGESVITNDTDLTLFSLLINSNYQRVVEHAEKLKEFDELIKMKTNSNYFEYIQGQIN